MPTAGIKANGRVEGAHFVANRMLAARDAGFIEDTAKNAADIAQQLREGPTNEQAPKTN